MNFRIQGIILFCLFVSFQNSFAGMSGESIVQDCKVKDVSHCYGYLLGIIESGYLSPATKKELLLKNNICLPAKITLSQLKRVVIKYADKYPEDLHLDSINLVLKSLAKYFPCKSEIDAAVDNVNKQYNESRAALCDQNPSPTNCTYTCSIFDAKEDKLSCQWPNGTTFLFKINEIKKLN